MQECSYLPGHDKPHKKPHPLARFFPVVEVLGTHRLHDYATDLLAGIIISVVLVPETIAYASLAGLPANMGLYTAIVAFLIYALVGPSRQLVVAPVSVVSLMVAAALGPMDLTPEEYVACATILSLVSGIFFILLGIMRAGQLENFISHPVLIGFTTAAALIVAITQVPHLLGIHLHSDGGSSNILYTLYLSIIHANECNWATLLIGLSGIISILLCHRISPLVPGPLVNLVLGVGIATALTGITGTKIETIGEIKGALPAFMLPRLNEPWLYSGSFHLGHLVGVGLIIGLVSFIETLSISKIMAGRTKRHVDANRELLSLGLANLGGAFFQCYPAAGSLSKSSVSFQAGSRSQLAAITAVTMVILTLLFLTHYLALVPKACLAAIVMIAVYHLIDFKQVIRAFKVKKTDGVVIIVTFLTTLALGVQMGILLGIIFSFGYIIWQVARPRVAVMGRQEGTTASFHDIELGQTETWHDLLIIKVDGPLYFANATLVENSVINLLADYPEVRTIIINAGAITDMDSSGDKVLWNLLRIMIQKEVHFLMVAVTKPVLKIMGRSGFYEFLGPENFYHALPEAVAAMGPTPTLVQSEAACGERS
ncbi:MAG: sulfate permease [Deltaproteobacteria bacterium]|nr:sulfate permease [Deltaproteobacteria bacterium]